MDTSAARNSGLGIFLPPEASELVNAWRRQYDPSFGLLDPHITLVYPPFVPPEEWPAVKPAIQGALAAFKPFSIALRSTGVFEGASYVLWLKPEDGGVLAQMRQALEQALPDYVPGLPFVYQPHVSIGFFPDLAALQQAQAKVEAELLTPIEFRVDTISYGFQLPDNRWRVFDRIRL